MKKQFFTAVLALCVGLSASAQSRTVPVKDFEVFVDLPTGFVFIKLPAGWKFVSRLERAELAPLSRHVHKALLRPEDDELEGLARLADVAGQSQHRSTAPASGP